MGNNRQVGLDGKIPWYIKEDFKHFKATTMGQNLIMGRKTFESIGRPLPGRNTVILTNNRNYNTQIPLAFSRDEALLQCEKINSKKNIFICGGGEIYKLFSGLYDEIYLSIVDYDGSADAYFPDIKLEETFDLINEKSFEAISETKTPGWKLKHFRRKGL